MPFIGVLAVSVVTFGDNNTNRNDSKYKLDYLYIA
jgi:hypothetical protein